MLGLAMGGALSLSVAQADTKPAANLLPEDTLAVITVPNIAKTNKAYETAPINKMVEDPAFKPFINKLSDSVQKHLFGPIEKEFSIDFAKLAELAQGQVTLAITPGAELGKSLPGFMALVDVGSNKSKAEALINNVKTQLSRKDVSFSEKRLQGSSFLEIGIPDDIIPDQLDGKGMDKIWFGMSQTLMIIGTEEASLNRVIISNQGGNPPTLSQNANFRSASQSMGGNFDSMGWINLSPIMKLVTDSFASLPQSDEGPNPAAMAAAGFNAMGLAGLQGLSFFSRRESNGEYNELTIHVPKNNRKGLFQILSGSAKPSGPLPFLPEGMASFSRSRIDMKEAFGQIEKMIASISPESAGFMTFMMAGIGKDQDKSFDFRRDFIGNLGDDIATVVMPAEGNNLEAIAQQPQMFLLGAGSSDKLLYSAKILSSLVPNLDVKSSDFLGKKILSADIPAPEGQEMGLYMTSHEGYLMITQNRALLEQAIRGQNGNGLRKLTGSSAYRRAVDKVGGTGTGLFGFDDPEKSLGPLLGAIKDEPELFQEIIDNITSEISLSDEGGSESWIDLSLLPDAGALAKYLEVSVYAGHIDNDGFRMKLYTPDPEGL